MACNNELNETSKCKNVSFIIREATPDDCGIILQLIKDLAVYEKEAESSVIVTEKDLVRDGFGESSYFKCLVAEVENKVVAYMIYAKSFSTWHGRSLWIEDIYVIPELRGNGIGREFFKTISKIALDYGMKKIRWNVLDWNKIAIDFYKGIGAIIGKKWDLCTLYAEEMAVLLKT